MYKPFTYLVVTYFPNDVPIYIGPTFYKMNHPSATKYEFN